MTHTPNIRAEAFVVAQMALLEGILGLPLVWPSRRPGGAFCLAGTLLMLSGGALAANAGALGLSGLLFLLFELKARSEEVRLARQLFTVQQRIHRHDHA